MQVDDGLEHIKRIHCLGGERFTPASYARLPNRNKYPFFVIGQRSITSVVCFLHTRGHLFLYQTPAQWSPRVIGIVVNTGTRGWVEPLTRAPRFEFMTLSLVFVDRCLSRTRILAASNKHVTELFSCQVDLRPTSGHELF